MTEPITFNRMNAADDLVLLSDVISTFKAHGIIVLGTDGHYNFVQPSTGELTAEISDIEVILTQHGLKVPPEVERIIKVLPLLLPMLGVQ